MRPRTPDDQTTFQGLSTDELLRFVRDGRGAHRELVTRFLADELPRTEGRPPQPTRPSDVAMAWYEEFLQRFVQMLPHFENEAAFVAYMRTAIRNRYRTDAGNHGRRRTVSPNDGCEGIDCVTPSEVARANEEDRQRAAEEETLRGHVAALDDTDRMIYRLVYKRRWSHRKVAELLYGGDGERHRQRVIRRLGRIKRQLESLIWAANGDTPEKVGHE